MYVYIHQNNLLAYMPRAIVIVALELIIYDSFHAPVRDLSRDLYIE